MSRKNQLLFWIAYFGIVSLLIIAITTNTLNQPVLTNRSRQVSQQRKKMRSNADHQHLGYLWIADGEVKGLKNGVRLPEHFALVIPAMAGARPVTKISPNAFFGCQEIKSLHLEEGINEIGQEAFGECTNLITVCIPKTITKIGHFAFVNCSKLTTFEIPAAVEEIGHGVLDGCNRLKNENVFNYSRVLFDWWVWNHGYPQTLAEMPIIELWRYRNSRGQPFSKVASGAFYAVNNLKKIRLNHITTIAEHAFDCCINLQTIDLPEGVKQIDQAAFCRCRSLEMITIPSSVTYLGSFIFAECVHLKHDHVINLSRVLFDWWVWNYRYDNKTLSDLQKINLADYKNSIDQPFQIVGDGAFKHCDNLKSILFNRELIKIGTGAFSNCQRLKKITLSPSVQEVGNRAFMNCCNLETIKIPNGVMTLGKCAFYACKNLGTVVLPSTIKKINNETFVGCQSLKNIMIPHGVKTIGCHAFSWCLNLKSIVLPEGLEKIYNQAFSFCRNLNELVLPQSMNELGEGVFESCSNLHQITIPSQLKRIGRYLFLNCTRLKKVWFEDGLTEIADGTFWNCHNLTKLRLPDSLKVIGVAAFKDCKCLKNIILPEHLNKLDANAFSGCCKLEHLHLSDQVNEIGEGAFKRCTNLKSIRLPQNINTIADQTFYYCHKLQEVNIPDHVSEIGDWAFYNCRKLKRISLPKNLVAISEAAFEDCQSLEAITIPAGVTSIAKNVFFNCPRLKPSKVVNYSKVLFDWWVKNQLYHQKPLGETEIVYLDDYRNNQGEPFSIIGEGAFDESKTIKELFLSERVTKITENNFEFSPSLQKIYLLNRQQVYEPSIFLNANSKIIFALANEQLEHQLLDYSISHERLEMISNDGTWFINSDDELIALTVNGQQASSLTVPRSINSINQTAFKGCAPWLKQINFSELKTNIEIAKGTFKHLTDVVYYANSPEVISRLINAGAPSHQIGIKQGIFFVTHNNSSSLLGLTEEGKQVHNCLQIPPNTNYISKQFWLDCQAKIIDLSKIITPNRLVISKMSLANRKFTYLVKDECLVKKLVCAGVNRADIKVRSSYSISK